METGGIDRTSGFLRADDTDFEPEPARVPVEEAPGELSAEMRESESEGEIGGEALRARLLEEALGGSAAGPANAPARLEGYDLLDGARQGNYLRAGSRGPEVAALQRALRAAGKDVPQDGTFGPETLAAVRQFQSEHGCTVDGVIGPQTLGALDRALGIGGAPAPAPSPGPGPAPAPSGSEEPSLPPGGSPPQGTNRPGPAGFKPAARPSPAVVAKANEILRNGNYPIGTHVRLTIEGKEYVFAVEWHKHAPTDNVPEGLKNWHRGVTVYERK